MSSIHLNTLCAMALGLGLGSAAWAQETPAAPAAETPAAQAPAEGAAAPDGLAMGKEAAPADGPGTPYVAATHGDWQQRCVRTEDGSDPCQLYQLLKDGEGNSVAEISMFALPEGQKAAAGATVVAPLETLLTANLALGVDSAKPKVYPFTWCNRAGCFARVGFTQAEIDAFKKGNKAVVTIVPAVAPDQKVELNVSLKGFTAGYEAVKAANAKNEAPAGN
ncbi:invasion associated locus B family protein [Cereibacter sphaeroides]|uniref:invasion associated locus B family protein n=1 Tax=Cereibacter sphaeroides TaxID=1063 RepID=UPI001F428317|nr:invasion associated locus B family protein [Cereibacter sphaeroides]MCE6962170.1 invasion associated locus B family protein [Cereibacter sphaeroides]MCE6970946.1 invasion associated locus B family protein [Cereibacter sphaeroides]MCE6972460.1 invasion associated locus B family protein [Cereibacter sphaeroides]